MSEFPVNDLGRFYPSEDFIVNFKTPDPLTTDGGIYDQPPSRLGSRNMS